MPETPGPHAVPVDVASVTVDAVTVDALARLQLEARRHGCRIVLQGATRELVELVAFMGLSEVLREVSSPGRREMFF